MYKTSLMVKFGMCCLLLLTGNQQSRAVSPNGLEIIPKPVMVKPGGEGFTITPSTIIMVPDNSEEL